MTFYCHQLADLQVEAEKRRHWDAWAKLHTSNEAMALVLGGASIQTFIIIGVIGRHAQDPLNGGRAETKVCRLLSSVFSGACGAERSVTAEGLV